MPHEDLDSISKLLQETAPLISEARAILREDDERWVLLIGEDTAVELIADLRLGHLGLSMPIGVPVDNRKSATYEAMMVMNGMWRQSGGIFFGVEEPGGQIQQDVELNLQQLNPEKLAAILKDFTDRGSVWKGIFEEYGGVDIEEHDEHLSAMDMEMQRV